MDSLIKGAYDLHVHSAPDILPRLMDDLDMIGRIRESGMAGYVIKSHYFCTAERATLINTMQKDCRAIGAITLNSSVGGINPTAVEMAGRAGAKLVWFPTCDSKHDRAHVFNGDPNKKLPYWAKILIQMKEEGIEAPVISILDEDGKLIPEVNDVLDIIKKYDMVLASSHISHEECFALVRRAKERGVERVIITHADFPTTYYTIEEQKELVSLGAYIEHCYTTWATKKVDLEDSISQIRAVGADHVVIATDLGQTTSIYPDQGMLSYAEKLVEHGFSENDVRKMVRDNPAGLIS